MIEVRLFATFRQGRKKIYMLNHENYTTVNMLLQQLEISPDEVAICLINGFHQPTSASLKDNDVISLFPPIGGG